MLFDDFTVLKKQSRSMNQFVELIWVDCFALINRYCKNINASQIFYVDLNYYIDMSDLYDG
jgi:hypothetical protein